MLKKLLIMIGGTIMIKKDLVQRRANYKRLKEAGFNSYESTRYKDLKEAKITALIIERELLKESIKKIVNGGGVIND